MRAAHLAALTDSVIIFYRVIFFERRSKPFWHRISPSIFIPHLYAPAHPTRPSKLGHSKANLITIQDLRELVPCSSNFSCMSLSWCKFIAGWIDVWRLIDPFGIIRIWFLTKEPGESLNFLVYFCTMIRRLDTWNMFFNFETCSVLISPLDDIYWSRLPLHD